MLGGVLIHAVLFCLGLGVFLHAVHFGIRDHAGNRDCMTNVIAELEAAGTENLGDSLAFGSLSGILS